jgi:hypothetical protein
VVHSKVLADEVETNLDQIEVSEPAPDDTEVSKASSPIEASQSKAQEAETKKVNEDDRPEGDEARGDNQ